MDLIACPLRDCPLSTYTKFSVGLAFFTPCCREGTCVYQGVRNVAFRGILRTYYIDGP